MRCLHCRQQYAYWVACWLHTTFRRRIPSSSRKHKSSGTVFFLRSRHLRASRFPLSICNVKKGCLTTIITVLSVLPKPRPCNSSSATFPTSVERTPTGKKPRRYDSAYCNRPTVYTMTGYGRPQSSETSTWSCSHLCRVGVIGDFARTILISVFTVSPGNGRYRTASIRLGSRGDSYYEYLLLAFCPVSRPS